MRAFVFAAAVMAGALAPAAAQDLDAQVTVVEELIARPRIPGPAWWKVSDADTVIYVLAEPPETPKGFSWDKGVLDRRLTGANRLILPADGSINPLSIARVMLLLPAARNGKTVEEQLSPPVKDKFQRLVASMGKTPADYDGWVLNFVTSNVERDYRVHRDLVSGRIQSDLEAAARTHRVRTQKAAVLPIARMSVKVKDLPGETCLDEQIDSIAARTNARQAMAEAWAAGDVRPLINVPRAAYMPASCNPERATNIAQLRAEVIADEVKTFEQALRSPGHAVAMLGVQDLLRRQGVLDQLRAKGYQITTPNLIED